MISVFVSPVSRCSAPFSTSSAAVCIQRPWSCTRIIIGSTLQWRSVWFSCSMCQRSRLSWLTQSSVPIYAGSSRSIGIWMFWHRSRTEAPSHAYSWAKKAPRHWSKYFSSFLPRKQVKILLRPAPWNGWTGLHHLHPLPWVVLLLRGL